MAMPLWSGDSILSIPTLAAEEAVCDLGSVSFGSDKFTFSWSVLDYANWPQGVDEVKSPEFCHPRSGEWCMVLCKDVSEALYLCFELLSAQKDATARAATLRASLVSDSGEKYEVNPPEFVCLDAPNKSTWKRLTGAFNPENGLDSALNFVGEVSVPSIVTDAYQGRALQRHRRSVADDLAELLESGQLADVTLTAGGEELEAHRAVLCARSPVFAAMLRHDTQEARTGRVHVRDIEPDVLREVLRFVYTDSTPLLEKMADRLLVAADKYDLPQLKEQCELELARNLAVDNAAATAVVALTHCCDLLKPCVISFLKRHLVPVMGSEGWATAVINHSKTVVELSRLIVKEPVENEYYIDTKLLESIWKM